MSFTQPQAAGAAVEETNFTGNSNNLNGNSRYGTTLNSPKPSPVSTRAVAPDLLRGLILPLMSLDHAALFLGAWLHGTPKQTENASTPLYQWNFNAAYVSRTITHLCAPGFFFLMGMGVVYFHKSRVKLGWGKGKMVKHFVVREVALTLVSEVLGESLMWKRGVWVVNIVLIGLAVDYLISGLVVVLMEDSEKWLARVLDGLGGGKGENVDGEDAPLLRNGTEEQRNDTQAVSSRAKSISFWTHNLILLALTYITIWWNIWLDPSHGQCHTITDHTLLSPHPSSIELLALTNTTAPASPPTLHGSKYGPWFDFWLYPVQNKYVMSGFPPPFAWLSFCLFGLVYARVMLFKRWSPKATIAGNLSVAVVLSLVFVVTRLLHFGNLSEGCLHMPEHLSRPPQNQYLASIQSFFYITKYPPSPSFFAFTMTVNFFLLALFSSIPPTVAKNIPGLMDFGGSALFFYVAHMYLYSFLSVPARYLFEHDLPDKPPNEWERTKGLGATAPFWIMWVLGLVILNPLCKAYGRFKAGKGPDSLWRFF